MGRLTLIERPEDVADKLVLTKRNRTQMADRQLNGTLNTIVEHVKAILARAN
jgi:hypothetical protein